VSERAGDYKSAADWVHRAISRSRNDWSLWLTGARIETEAGNIANARRDLHEAERLNPHSSIFSNP
jgi:Flp pilus assembly protein TadD